MFLRVVGAGAGEGGAVVVGIVVLGNREWGMGCAGDVDGDGDMRGGVEFCEFFGEPRLLF